MIPTLISIFIAGLVLCLIYYITGRFIKGEPLKIIRVILGFILLFSALRAIQATPT